MQARDLEWLQDTLPWVVGSVELAEAATKRALGASGDADSAPELRVRRFWEALGWEVADALQARWAFGELTLEDATMLSHELAEHIMGTV